MCSAADPENDQLKWTFELIANDSASALVVEKNENSVVLRPPTAGRLQMMGMGMRHSLQY
jgi:hypothetical protein